MAEEVKLSLRVMLNRLASFQYAILVFPECSCSLHAANRGSNA
jgi:hypothetical protein